MKKLSIGRLKEYWREGRLYRKREGDRYTERQTNKHTDQERIKKRWSVSSRLCSRWTERKGKI